MVMSELEGLRNRLKEGAMEFDAIANDNSLLKQQLKTASDRISSLLVEIRETRERLMSG